MTKNSSNQVRQEVVQQQDSPSNHFSKRQMLPPISSFAGQDEGRRLSSPPSNRGLRRMPSSSDELMRPQRPLSASDQRMENQPSLYAREYSTTAYNHPRSTHLEPTQDHGSPHMNGQRLKLTSPSGMARMMHDAPERYSEGVPASNESRREDPASWHRHTETSGTLTRSGGPSESYRNDPSWQNEHQRVQNQAYSRQMRETRWLEERNRRAESGYHPHHQGGYTATHTRQLGRSLDSDSDEEMRRLKRPGAIGNLSDTAFQQHNLYSSSNQSAGPRSYSPPDSLPFVHRDSSRPGVMMSVDPPRPASTVGVMAVTGSTPTASSSNASSGASTVSANRRVAHLLSEQKRRESINTGFEDLRQAIPTCRDGQDSKATILRRALEYIRELESIVNHTHRVKHEGQFVGVFDNRSPPDDKDELRRLGRADDGARRDSRMGQRGPHGGSDQLSGSHMGGMPGHSYALHQPGGPFALPGNAMPHYGQTRMTENVRQDSAGVRVKREPETSFGLGSKRRSTDDDGPLPRGRARHMVSDEDYEEKTDSRNSSLSASSSTRYVVAQPAENETVPASFAMRDLQPSPSLVREDPQTARASARLIPC